MKVVKNQLKVERIEGTTTRRFTWADGVSVVLEDKDFLMLACPMTPEALRAYAEKESDSGVL
jgi:hypothetical protein